jgi:hypothetical protein
MVVGDSVTPGTSAAVRQCRFMDAPPDLGADSPGCKAGLAVGKRIPDGERNPGPQACQWLHRPAGRA